MHDAIAAECSGRITYYDPCTPFPPPTQKTFPYWKLLLLALFAMVIVAAALASLPILIKQILESTFIDEDPSLMQTAVLAMIALFIIRGIASYLSIFTVNKATGKLGIDLRLDF